MKQSLTEFLVEHFYANTAEVLHKRGLYDDDENRPSENKRKKTKLFYRA